MEMEKNIPEIENNIIELNEENEKQKVIMKPTQTPTRHLRDIKKVNYSKFFSEDPDNSEDYEPEEESHKNESTKKRARTKSTMKSSSNTNNQDNAKKKKEENEANNKMDIEEEHLHEQQDKNNKNVNVNNNSLNHIINIADTIKKYSNINNDNNNTNNANNINIPNSDLILIMLEICLNSSQFGLEKDNSSRAFWEEVGKIELLKPITSKFKPETLRKYWRTIREAKKFKKIIAETKKYKNELDNNNLKLLSSIRVICEYVSSASKRKIDYFLNKHIVKPANKTKKINVNDMSPTEQISDVINTFISCFPKKKEKDIIDALLRTSFDIENTFLVLKDKENLNFLSFSEKDDEIVKRNYEDKDDNNEEYLELINIKGLEDVIRRKEFLFNVKIDRSQYQYNKNEEVNEKELEVVDDDKKEKKENENNADDKNNDNNEQNIDEKDKIEEDNEK
jgi:hypothetical protein